MSEVPAVTREQLLLTGWTPHAIFMPGFKRPHFSECQCAQCRSRTTRKEQKEMEGTAHMEPPLMLVAATAAASVPDVSALAVDETDYIDPDNVHTLPPAHELTARQSKKIINTLTNPERYSMAERRDRLTESDYATRASDDAALLMHLAKAKVSNEALAILKPAPRVQSALLPKRVVAKTAPARAAVDTILSKAPERPTDEQVERQWTSTRVSSSVASAAPASFTAPGSSSAAVLSGVRSTNTNTNVPTIISTSSVSSFSTPSESSEYDEVLHAIVQIAAPPSSSTVEPASLEADPLTGIDALTTLKSAVQATEKRQKAARTQNAAQQKLDSSSTLNVPNQQTSKFPPPPPAVGPKSKNLFNVRQSAPSAQAQPVSSNQSIDAPMVPVRAPMSVETADNEEATDQFDVDATLRALDSTSFADVSAPSCDLELVHVMGMPSARYRQEFGNAADVSMRLYASHRPMTSASEGAALAQRIRKAAQLQAALKTKDQTKVVPESAVSPADLVRHKAMLVWSQREQDALQRGAVAASLRDDVASFDAVPPAVWSSNPLVGLQAPAHLISPFSSRAPRPATDAFDQAQNAAEEYDRQMELQQQLAAERRLAQLQAEAELMANAANAVERARLREIAADADQFDLRFRRLMEVATDSNSAPRASGDLKADAKSYGEDPVWMPDWSEPLTDDDFSFLSSRLPSRVLSSFELRGVELRGSEKHPEVIVSVHKLSRQPYRVKLFSDARRFNIEQRCLQALPDEGSLVFVDAMCTVRPASVLLLELHPPVQPESTVLFSDADFHFMHLQLPELSRAQVRDVVHQLALSLRDLHANNLVLGHSSICHPFLLARTVYLQSPGVVSWTVSDLALAQSSGSALPPQLLQYEFAAPEVLDAYRSNFTDFTASHAAHDVWALGALLFTLYFRRCLFDDQESAMAESAVAAAPLVGTVSTSVSALPSKLKSSKQTLVNKHYKYSARRPSMWRHVENAKLVDLLDKLLVDAPHRITIDEVVNHEYFSKSEPLSDKLSHITNDDIVVKTINARARVEFA